MDIGRAFTHLFEDERWVTKVLVGGILVLLSFLVIPGLLVGGYMIEYVRRVALGEGDRLPEWSDWGEYFAKGVLSFFIELVYSLPLILVGICFSLFAAAAGNQSDSNVAIRTFAAVCLGLPATVYGLFIAFVLPAARLRYAVQGDLGAAFQFGEVFRLISTSLGNYVVFIVAAIAASLVAFLVSLVTLPLCGIGLLVIPFATFWSYAVWANALGRVHAAAGGQAAPTSSLTVA
jgi:hypothetical protein